MYECDYFRNLTGISQSPGGNLATFSYDGDGKRISKLSGGVRTIYHYDKEGRLLSESEANGNAICDYIYLGKNIVGRMDGAPPASTGIYYYHTDPAGTPLAVTGSNGAVVWRGYYEPFGNEYAIQGTIGNDIRFAGNMKDDETGLNYFGARYLDSKLGRFEAPDPVAPVDAKTGKVNATILAEPQRLNPYAYGLNGPGRYVDKDGECAWLIVPVAAYLLLHYYDIANAPTSPNEPTYASNRAADIVEGGALLMSAVQAVGEATAPVPGPAGLSEAAIESLNTEQAANLARFEAKLPNGAKPTKICDLPSGGKAFQSEVPGRVPGSSAIYEKQVDAFGNTVQYTKTTIAPDGSIVSVKQKFP
jgi:RHS repeat-associated protein